MLYHTLAVWTAQQSMSNLSWHLASVERVCKMDRLTVSIGLATTLHRR